MKTLQHARSIAAPALLAGLLGACTSGTGGPVATPSPRVVPSQPAAVAASPSPTSQPVPSGQRRAGRRRCPQGLLPDRRPGGWVPHPGSALRAPHGGCDRRRDPRAVGGSDRGGAGGIYPGRREGIFPLSTGVPADTHLLGIEIEDGVATVDLSGAFGSGEVDAYVYRQAQVDTATQFPTVDRVAFRLDGKPMAAIEGRD